MLYVSPSYRYCDLLGEPYYKDDKLVVKVRFKGKIKECRLFNEWDKRWKGKEPKIIPNPSKPDSFIGRNFDGFYLYFIGIATRKDGRVGFWKYRELTLKDTILYKENVVKSPLFGWICPGNLTPDKAYDPVWINRIDVLTEEDCYRSLGDDWEDEEWISDSIF